MNRRLHLSWQPAPSVEYIIERTAHEYGITLAQIYGDGRCGEFVIPRHEACLRAHEQGYSLGQIGRPLGRDHTTIINAIRRAKERRSNANE